MLAEGIAGGFTNVYGVLKVLEERGQVRRGYFVDGLGAAQFAIPGAVDRLRRARETPDPLLHPDDVPDADRAGLDRSRPSRTGRAVVAGHRRPPGAQRVVLVVIRAGEPLVWFDRAAITSSRSRTRSSTRRGPKR